MQARYYVYLGIAAFFTFSIGLNIGLLGFHNFHFEHGAARLKADNSISPPDEPNTLALSNSALHSVDVLSRRPSLEVPGDLVLPSEVAVQRDTSSLSIKTVFTRDENKDSVPLHPVEDPLRHHVGPDLKGSPPPAATATVDATPGVQNPFSAMGDGPIATFLQQGGEIPIVLITCSRVELLDQTIQSLLKVQRITKDIVVIQDGTLQGIADVAKKHGLQIVQNKENDRRLRGNDGASRIATHYKFALSSIFDLRPKAPAAIVIEDDLLFSPDFYEYFLHTAVVVEQDKSVFAVSAWNDNGFKGRVGDPLALRRTEYFPGLGWLLSRDLYKTELEKKWPKTHWDHWLRAPETHKGREIVYPQVPRTYHNGIKGTFMNMDTHNQYFRDIAYNQDPAVDWDHTAVAPAPAYSLVTADNYESRLHDLMKTCHHVSNVQDFINHRAKAYCIWIHESEGGGYGAPPFQPIAKVFGIWHEHRRGVHHGLHEFYWSASASTGGELSYFLVINTLAGGNVYEKFKPAGVPLLSPLNFRALLPHLRGGRG